MKSPIFSHTRLSYMGKRIIIVHVCFSSQSSLEKKEWVNSNMELLPHTHFIFLFAVVGNDRNGSNCLCSSNFSGQQNWKRRIDSLHYPIWFCNYRFHGRYRSQWIHLKMIFHESIDATFFFLAGTSDDRIRTTNYVQ